MEQTARRVAGGGVGGGRLGSKTLLLIRLRGPAFVSKCHAKSSCPRTQLCRKEPAGANQETCDRARRVRVCLNPKPLKASSLGAYQV
jgi:hypothetical protein